MKILEVFIDWLIKTSFNGAVLVCMILLVKRILDKRIGARGHYYIWLLLVIKLIMPFSPQCFTSIYNLMNVNKTTVDTVQNVFRAQEIKRVIEEPVWDQGLFSESLLHSTDFKILLIWLIGIFVFSILTIRTNFRFWKSIKKSNHKASDEYYHLLGKCKSVMQIHKKIDIFFTESVNAPMLTGLINPKILIPSYMKTKLSHEQYQHIFLHELTHFKKRDIYIFFLINVLQILHWFNPIIWFGFIKMRQDCEVACDTLVLSNLKENEYKSYGQTIIYMLQNFQGDLQPLVTVGVLGNRGEIKRRIKMISKFKKNSHRFSIIATVIFIVMGFAFLTSAINTPEEANLNEPNSDSKLEMLWPIPGYTTIVNPYGSRESPVTGKKHLHTGIDIAAPEGVDIIVPADGKVTFAGWQESYGKAIAIDHGEGIITFYAHCSEYLVKEGQIVKAGEKIAEVGSTGMSTGAHLHFEVRKNEKPVDPLEGYLKENNN